MRPPADRHSADPLALVEVHGLHVARGGALILEIERLAVRAGEVLAVIGPNGAGKSTLLMSLGALLPVQQGTLRYRGNPVAPRDALAYRRRTSLVLQEPLLLSTSVYHNVASGLRFHGLPREEVAHRARTWMEKLGISALSDRPAARLSGGEAQRVSLARALALQPDLLLLDEPFSALDAPTRAQLLGDLRRVLEAEAITAIFVTHDLDEAMLLGDRVAVLMGGRLRQIGAPDEVYRAPADAGVAAFVGVETLLPGRVTAAGNGHATIDVSGARLHVAASPPPGRDVLVCLRPEDVTLHAAGEKPAGREIWLAARVIGLTPAGPMLRAALDCGFPLVALVPRSTARELGLAEGQRAWASFPPAAAHLIAR